MGRRILIAGCGDLGTRIGLRLAAAGDTVFALRRRIDALPPALHPIAADLSRPVVDLPDGVDALVYCATPDARDEASYRRVFLTAPSALLSALPDPPLRVLFVSSTAVYGEDSGAWVDERTPESPSTFNGRILLEAERTLAGRVAGCVVLRCSGLYGPGRERMLRRARAGETGSARWSNRIHVDDAAAAAVHLLALDAPMACYLGSDDRPEREDHLLAWMRGESIAGADSVQVRGKRIRNLRLRASGFEFSYPDFRAGWAFSLRPEPAL